MPEYQEEFFGTGVLSGFGSTDNNEPHSDDLLWVALSIVDDDSTYITLEYVLSFCSGDMATPFFQLAETTTLTTSTTSKTK